MMLMILLDLENSDKSVHQKKKYSEISSPEYCRGDRVSQIVYYMARTVYPSIKRFCVIRSPHVDKNSREHFEIRTHKRLIDILNPNSKTIDALTRLSMPAGVDISIKL